MSPERGAFPPRARSGSATPRPGTACVRGGQRSSRSGARPARRTGRGGTGSCRGCSNRRRERMSATRYKTRSESGKKPFFGCDHKVNCRGGWQMKLIRGRALPKRERENVPKCGRQPLPDPNVLNTLLLDEECSVFDDAVDRQGGQEHRGCSLEDGPLRKTLCARYGTVRYGAARRATPRKKGWRTQDADQDCQLRRYSNRKQPKYEASIGRTSIRPLAKHDPAPSRSPAPLPSTTRTRHRRSSRPN